LLFLLLLAAGRAWAAPLEQAVAARKKAAARLAAAGKWNLAVHEIEKAKVLVRDAARAAANPPKKAVDPHYRQELLALQHWLSSQNRLAGPARDRAARQYRAKLLALQERYGIRHAPPSANERQQQLAGPARFDLLSASLDDVQADYFARQGDRARAETSRKDAARTRLQAYRTLGRTPQAGQAADQLLKLPGADLVVYGSVGDFFVEQKQYARAAAVWKRGIQLLESGKSRSNPGGNRSRLATDDQKLFRSGKLAGLYRRLAFCYTRLGKTAEAKQALRQAANIEASAAALPKSR
jgi:hypothetical protein